MARNLLLYMAQAKAGPDAADRMRLDRMRLDRVRRNEMR